MKRGGGEEEVSVDTEDDDEELTVNFTDVGNVSGMSRTSSRLLNQSHPFSHQF